MRLKLNLRGLRRCRTEHVEIQDAESLTRIVGASSGSLAWPLVESGRATVEGQLRKGQSTVDV